MSNPGTFMLRAVRAFRANQGLLLAGAVAYYTLLSIVPVLILMLIVLSRVIDQHELLDTLARYLEWLIPGQSAAVIARARALRRASRRDRLGAAGDDAVLQLARVHGARERDVGHLRPSGRDQAAALHGLRDPALLLHLLSRSRIAAGDARCRLAQVMGTERIDFLGYNWSLRGLSGALLYLLGVAGEILVLTSIYLVMPVGRLSWRHALVGGVTATVLWEITRHVLVWYFGTLSQVTVVYGSLTTSIVVLLSLEIARDAAALRRAGDRRVRAYRHTVGKTLPRRRCTRNVRVHGAGALSGATVSGRLGRRAPSSSAAIILYFESGIRQVAKVVDRARPTGHSSGRARR